MRYPEIEKLALSFVVLVRKLRPYFQALQIKVLTKSPILLDPLKTRHLRKVNEVANIAWRI